MRKPLYLAFSSLLLVLSIRPCFADPNDDSYPFSTYPMFASKRKAPLIAKAEGRLPDGSFESIAPELIGIGEVMQAAVTLKRAARSKKTAQTLCNSIYADAEKGTYTQVRIVWVSYDPVEYFVSGPRPLQTQVVATCGKKKRRSRRR